MLPRYIRQRPPRRSLGTAHGVQRLQLYQTKLGPDGATTGQLRAARCTKPPQTGDAQD